MVRKKKSSSRQPIKALNEPKESFSIEKSRIHENPKLQKLVATFKKAHKAYCNHLLQATYRLIHDARLIGELLLKMMQEGSFISKRQLHVWLELQANVAIPQPTFYRYIQAAEDFQKVEVIHGTKMLMEITSNKVLKMLANPKVRVEPQVYGWEHTDEGFTKGDWTIRNHNGTKHLWESHNSKGEKGFVMGSLKDILEAVQSKIDKTSAPNGQTAAGTSISHSFTQETQNTVIERGDNGEQKPTKGSYKSELAQTEGVTHFHHGCRDFKIDDDRTLTFTDQHGNRVYVLSEEKGIHRLLSKEISSITGKRRAQ